MQAMEVTNRLEMRINMTKKELKQQIKIESEESHNADKRLVHYKHLGLKIAYYPKSRKIYTQNIRYHSAQSF